MQYLSQKASAVTATGEGGSRESVPPYSRTTARKASGSPTTNLQAWKKSHITTSGVCVQGRAGPPAAPGTGSAVAVTKPRCRFLNHEVTGAPADAASPPASSSQEDLPQPTPPQSISPCSARAASRERAGTPVSTEQGFDRTGTCAQLCESTARAHTPQEQLLVKEV